jgi:hypothetical protein
MNYFPGGIYEAQPFTYFGKREADESPNGHPSVGTQFVNARSEKRKDPPSPKKPPIKEPKENKKPISDPPSKRRPIR